MKKMTFLKQSKKYSINIEIGKLQALECELKNWLEQNIHSFSICDQVYLLKKRAVVLAKMWCTILQKYPELKGETLKVSSTGIEVINEK